MMRLRICKALTSKTNTRGVQPCKKPAMLDDYCWFHIPIEKMLKCSQIVKDHNDKKKRRRCRNHHCLDGFCFLHLPLKEDKDGTRN